MNRRRFPRKETRRSWLKKAGLFVPASFAIIEGLLEDAEGITPQQRNVLFSQRPPQPVVSGSGGAGFVYVQSALTEDSDSVSLTGVGTGNLVVVFAKRVGATENAAISDGTTSLTMVTKLTWDLVTSIGYLLSANGGNQTYTATWGTPERRGLIAVEFSHSGTASYDTTQATGSNSTNPAVSGNISTSGSNNVVLGFYGLYAPFVSFSSPTLGGVAATPVPTSAGSQLWGAYGFSPITNGQFSLSLSNSANGNCHIVSFKC